MEAIPTPLQIRWLSAPGAAPVPTGADRPSIPIPAPPPTGRDRAEVELLDLASGMQFCQVAHRFARG